MAQEVIKVLGQSRPAAATETVLYSVALGKRAVIASLFIFNNTAGNAIIDLSIVPGGANDIGTNPTALQNTILNQLTITTKKGHTDITTVAGGKITLNELDDIRIETDTVGVVFHVYGVEVVPEKN